MKFSYLLLTLLVILSIFGANHLLVEAGKKHHNKGGIKAPKFGSIKSGTVVLDFNSAQGKAQKFKH